MIIFIFYDKVVVGYYINFIYIPTQFQLKNIQKPLNINRKKALYFSVFIQEQRTFLFVSLIYKL